MLQRHRLVEQGPHHPLDAPIAIIADQTLSSIGPAAPPASQRAPPQELPVGALHHREGHISAQDDAQGFGDSSRERAGVAG